MEIPQHTFNVTGCIFTIQPRQTEIRQGDTIGFDVTVTCGEKRVIADEIYISLMESMTVRGGRHSSVKHYNRDKKILASNITMEAGESHSFEFITKLPDDCVLSDGQEITGNPMDATDGWCLYMHVENGEHRVSAHGKADAVGKSVIGGIGRFMEAIGKLVGNDRIGRGIGEMMERMVLRRDPRNCFFLTIKSR